MWLVDLRTARSLSNLHVGTASYRIEELYGEIYKFYVPWLPLDLYSIKKTSPQAARQHVGPLRAGSLVLPEVLYWSRNLEQSVCLFHFAPFNHTLFLPPFTLPQWTSGRAHDFLIIFNLWNSVQSRWECTMSQPIQSPSGEGKIGGKNHCLVGQGCSMTTRRF